MILLQIKKILNFYYLNNLEKTLTVSLLAVENVYIVRENT